MSDDTNGLSDIYVHDFVTGMTVRASVNSAGGQAVGGDSLNPMLSGDGRCVVLESLASNLTPNDTSNRDIFVHELDTGITTRVGAGGFDPAISRDGRFVTFTCGFPLVAGDTNGDFDIYVHDRLPATTTLVSVDSNGALSNGTSLAAAISSDGRHVSFASEATNLVASDTNGFFDVFVRSLRPGSRR